LGYGDANELNILFWLSWNTFPKPMDYNKDKVDDMVLALLFLTMHELDRAWKGHDWEAMNRLHQKGMISDPVGKVKSVMLTEEGKKRSEELFRKYFCSSQ